MRASQAREVANHWLHEEWLPALGSHGPGAGFSGAYVMGSLAGRSDDEVFDEQVSDLDVAIVVDPAVLPPDHDRYPNGKFTLHRGCVIQAIFVPRQVFEDDEKLLTMLGLGCNLRHAHILDDRQGVLAAAQETVREQWGDRRWVVRRTERAIEFAEGAVADLAGADSPIQQLMTLSESVMQLSGLVAIAHAETPTHRRSLARARARLQAYGRSDLVGGLVAAIGAQQALPATVEATISDALLVLEIERRYGGDSADLSPEFQQALPDFFTAGIRDLIDDGFVSEAMLPALAGVAVSAWIAHPLAEAADRVTIEELVTRTLQRAGIPAQPWADRQHLIADLLEEMATFCRSISRGSTDP